MDPYDGTPLYYAAHGGHMEVCRYLLQAGARCDEKTYMGERVFYAALNDNLRNLLKSYSLAKVQAHPFRVHMATLLSKANCGNPSEGGGDVTFVVGGEEMTAHRFVLSGRCPYLGERFSDPNKHAHDKKLTSASSSSASHYGKWFNMPIIKIEHDSVTPEAFRGLLQYLYTGRVELPAAHVKPFRILCKRCQLHNVLAKIPGDEDIKSQEEKEDRDKVIKMGQLILDEGHEALLESFRQVATTALKGHSMGYDIRIRVPTGRDDNTAECSSSLQQYATIPLHRAVLTTQSPYFEALLTPQSGGLMFSEAAAAASDDAVTLHDMPLPIFRIVVGYLYSGRLELVDTEKKAKDDEDGDDEVDGLDIETIYNVLEASEVLLLPRLKTLCGTALAALVTRSLTVVGNSKSSANGEFEHTEMDAATVVLDGLEIALRFEIDKLEDHCYDAIAQKIDLFFNEKGRQAEEEPCGEDPRIRFEKMIEENAWTVKNRQAADSIPIIDGVKGALSDIFRESSGHNDIEGQHKPEINQTGEFFRRMQLVDSCLQKLGLTTATGEAMGAFSGVLASRDQ